MSEDNKKRENVRQREIKPRAGSEGKKPPEKARSAQADARPKNRSKQNQKRRKSSAARPPASGSEKKPTSGKGQRQTGQQKKDPAKKSNERSKDREFRPAQGPEGKKEQPKQRRRSKRTARHNRPIIRVEETVDDVIRDIARIEKDIMIDIDAIRNQKLDL